MTPLPIEELILSAQRLYGAGRFAEAEAACRQILQVRPQQHSAIHLLGVLACRGRRFEEGYRLLETAISSQPTSVEYRLNYGIALNEGGKWGAAEPVLRELLAAAPDHPLALNNLANAVQMQGRSAEAVEIYRQALVTAPDLIDARVNLAASLRSLARFDEAVTVVEEVLQKIPNHVGALHQRGMLFADGHRLFESETVFRRVVQLAPDHHQALFCLGTVLSDQGRWYEAADAYAEAIRQKPDYAEAHQALAVMLKYTNRVTEALIAVERSLQLRPNFTLAFQTLGATLSEVGRTEEAVEVYRRSLDFDPDQPHVRSNLLYALCGSESISREQLWQEHRRWAEVHIANKRSLPCPKKASGDRLRIGYVSPDLRQHSVSYFLAPVLAAHDRNRVEVICYSDVVRPDSMTARLRGLADGWVDISRQNTEQVCSQIEHDQIDILIDLAGHTMGNRLAVFARRPAPIQITWLGYPETTGLSTIDYKITDSIAWDESDGNAYASERPLRLPGGFHCYEAPAGCPSIAPAPMLANGYVTFGSFASLAKVTPAMVGTWTAVLREVPNSRMLIKARQLADRFVRDRIASMFAASGVSIERLRFELTVADTRDHLALYREIDIVLDTFPYNGTTTLCEGLWMGVPAVTLKGDRPASRMGASLLHQLELDSLVAQTREDFVAIAKDLATDHSKLIDIRNSLRDRFAKSTLGNAASFARELEDAFDRVTQR